MTRAHDSADYLPCSEILELLGAYLDGELGPEVRREFDRHLEACPACVAYLATYRETIALARAAARDPEVTVAELPKEIVQLILAVRR